LTPFGSGFKTLGFGSSGFGFGSGGSHNTSLPLGEDGWELCWPQVGQQLIWGFQGVDLPAGPLSAERQQAIQIVGGLLGAGVGTDMPGLQTVTNCQQIHTPLG
jgi:hypothetical protein